MELEILSAKVYIANGLRVSYPDPQNGFQLAFLLAVKNAFKRIHVYSMSIHYSPTLHEVQIKL
jgi:hypothetical protein